MTEHALQAIKNHISNIPQVATLYVPVLIEAVESLRQQMNEVYTERNRLIALAAALAERDGMEAGVREHEGEAEPGWATVVCIDLPTGQVSWHLPDAEADAFTSALPEYPGSWDGHTTEQKHARIEAFLVPPAEGWQENWKEFIGPCVHGRDPYTRCDYCGNLTPREAKENAEAEKD